MIGLKRFACRKWLAFLASGVLVISSAMPSRAFAAENESRAGKDVVYTCSGQGNDTGTGSETNPYKNFEDAVKNVADGGTIIVQKKGIYTGDRALHH